MKTVSKRKMVVSVRRLPSLLRRHSLGTSRNLPPPRTSAETNGHIPYPLFKKISRRPRGDHPRVNRRLVIVHRKPIISCDRTTPKKTENRFQILASCMDETPKIVGNNCFLCSFPLIPKARMASVQWTSHT